MDIEQEIARGSAAQRILESEPFKDAVAKVQQDIFDKFAATDPKDVDAMRIERIRLKCLADIVRQIAEVVTTGTLAQAKLEHERTLLQKTKDRVAQGLRRVF